MRPSALLLAVLASAAPLCAQGGPSVDRSADVEGRFGELVAQIEGLVDPVDLLFDGQGRLFVLERRGRRIRSFDAEGAPLASAGGPDLWLVDLTPSRLALVDGNLELAHEEPGSPIYYVDPDGLGWLGGGGSSPEGAAAVAVGAPGDGPGAPARAVLAAGSPSIRWSGAGPDRTERRLGGPFVDPADLAFLPDGALAVVDPALHELLVFAPDGGLRLRTGDFGHFPGQLSAPSGLAVHGERVYLADTHNHRIQVRSLDGALLYEWGKHALLPRQGRGHLHYPSDVAVSPDGTRAAVLEPFEGRVQVFGPATRPADAYRTDPATLGADPTGHFGPPVAAHGRYAATLEPETQELHVHDLDSSTGTPVLVGRAGGYGARLGEFRGAADLAFAPEGDLIWVLDRVERRLSAFDLIRDEDDEPRFRRDRVRYTASLELGTLLDGLRSAEVVATDAEGRVWIVDPVGRRLGRVAGDLRSADWVHAWGGGDAPGPRRVLDLSIGPDGAAVLVGEARCWRLAPGAERLEALPGGRAGGVDHDAEGRIWRTDRDAHRVEGPDGPVGSGPGLGHLEFTDPRGIALSGDGRLVVVDHGNHRLQALSVEGALLGLAGPRPYLREALRPDSAAGPRSPEEQPR